MGKKVLIAESDSTVLQVISYFLKLEGFEISTVSDGTVALDVASRFMPDVIILDPALSGVNGIKVSRDIRSKPEFPGFKDVPILYVIEDMDSLLKTGEEIPPGYGIIYKPIDPTKMVNTIKECMEASSDTSGDTSGDTSDTSFEKVEPMGPIGIEELLGWNVSEDSNKDVKKKDIILENESAILNDNMEGIAGVEGIEEQIPAEITEVAMEEIEKEMEQTGYVSTVSAPPPLIPPSCLPPQVGEEFGRNIIAALPQGEGRLEGATNIPQPVSEGLTKGDENGSILRQAQDDKHSVMVSLSNHDRQLENQRDKNVPPILNSDMDRRGFLTPPEGFSSEAIEKMLSKISREFIEKVVMDVVPRIAEEEIKKEIERLKGESG